jgi:metal-responsive CopG/Arc/MetJ family transcriptional regulator
MWMKVVQFTIEEELLRRLDADPEVRRDGRSAVLRRAATLYLRQKQDRDIADRYRRGYTGKPAAREELGPWSSDPIWPEEP